MSTKKKIISIVSLILGIALVLVAVFAVTSNQTKTITILQSSDVHGTILPYEYSSGRELKYSLAHASTIIKQERKANPNLLLIDTGDISQGNSVQMMRKEAPHPAIQALNYLNYDAWILGNHEFNFEYSSLCKEIDEFQGVTLTGNMYKNGEHVLPSTHIFEIDKVKIAVIGLCAPHIPIWEGEKTDHYDNADFIWLEEEFDKAIEELKGKADIIVAAVHYGPEGEFGNQGMRALAEKYHEDIDGFLIGHSHAAIYEDFDGVPLLEPGKQANYLSKLSFTVKKHGGSWEIIDRKGELLDCREVEPDSEFVAEFADYDQKLKAMLDAQIGTIGKTFLDPIEFLPGIPSALLQDNPLTDFINMVQLSCSGADISASPLYSVDAILLEGPYRIRDSLNIVPFEDDIVTLTITGKQLKDILEQDAGMAFQTYKKGDVTIAFDPGIRIYKIIQFAGVDYEIDISQPVGQRIKNILFHGAPLKADEKLTMVTTDYYYATILEEGIITEDSFISNFGLIHDCFNAYVEAQEASLMPACDGNWRIIGAELDDPQKELIYEMVREGELVIPSSEDGRTPDVQALNGPELRKQGILPSIEETKK